MPESKAGERIGGGLLVLLVVGISTAAPFFILRLAYGYAWWLGLLLETFMCYQLLATKALQVESMRVYRELADGSLEGARRAVSMIVGRDTRSLDEKGITKATVETIAENASDGVIAPLFYMMAGGAVLGFFYKSINTMDSMIGYKNDKYRYFGTCAARLDDVVNFIPARLGAGFMILAAGLCGANRKNARKIYRRDRHNHPSPNSAQTEAVMAGALEIQLAGDAYYFGELHKKPTIGDDIRPVEAEDIVGANNLMYATSILGTVVFALAGSLAHLALRLTEIL